MSKKRAGKSTKLTLLVAFALSCGYLFELKTVAAEPPSKVVDLSHILGPNLPDFHVGNTTYEYKQLFSIAKDGYADGQFTTPEHYGTHMDAPSHFYQNGQTIDQLPANKLILPGIVIDVRKEVEANNDYRLTVAKIQAFEKRTKIPQNSVVLLLTGWSARFGNAKSYRNADKNGTMHFPAFSGEAADYLINKKEVTALGVDTLSADYGLSKDYVVHKTALAKGVFLIENLNNLEQLPAKGTTIFLGPIRIKNGSGSPARILALLPE